MKVLITGASGYLGGRLATHLSATSHFDLRLASRSAVYPGPPRTETMRVDWGESGTLDRLCEGVDAVVHLAGMNATDSAANPVAALEVNGVNTARLLRAAVRERTRRFLYLSTAHVYGAALSGRVTEATCPRPVHPYATSHRAGEDVVESAGEGGEIEAVVIRLSNAFGAPIDPNVDCWRLLVNDLCRQAIESGALTLRSPGTDRRDFLTMSDACSAIEHLLEGSDLRPSVLNVGGGWAPTVLEVAQLVAARCEALFGFTPTIVRPPVGSSESPGRVLDYSIDALLATGFRPAGDREREIDALLHFCRAHFSAA